MNPTDGRPAEKPFMGRKHNFFGSDTLEASLPLEDLDSKIARAVRYMATKVGLRDGAILGEVISKELSRKFASRSLNYIATQGIDIRKGRILDLGAGLGKLSEEAALRGAKPIAIEPGTGLGEIVFARIRRVGSGVVIAAVGEKIPFRDNSFDVVISLQVLEHVEDPTAVLREAYRILKPGGWLYLTCENYLSFREPHYQVAWLPLLPKSLGSLYLRLRGRPIEFLNTSITYTTLPWVRRTLRKCGFVSMRERKIHSLCSLPSSIKTPWKRVIVQAALRLVSTDSLVRALTLLNQTANLCIPVISELVQKPELPIRINPEL